jgi:hypothetical protein
MIAAIISNPFGRLSPRAALDILIIAMLIYYTLKLLRGTRAMQMLIAILLLVVLYEGARRAQFEMVEWLLDTLLPYVAIALIVLFQPEIRRALLFEQSHLLVRRCSARGRLLCAESYRRPDHLRTRGGPANVHREWHPPGRQSEL